MLFILLLIKCFLYGFNSLFLSLLGRLMLSEIPVKLTLSQSYYPYLLGIYYNMYRFNTIKLSVTLKLCIKIKL